MKKRKESRWRREKEQRRKQKTKQVIVTFLAIISFILAIGFGWRAYGAFKDSAWDGENRLNLVLKIEPISIVSFDPHTQTISLLNIPDGTYIEAASGYGPYRIEKIFPLGELEGRGMALLVASLETYFGLPIDGWMRSDEDLIKTAEEKRILTDLIFLAFKNKSLTSLSRWDLVRLWLMTNRTRGHKIETVDLGETTITEEFDLPDGTQAKKVNEQRISRIISNLFPDYRLRQEDLTIALMNAGDERGLAAKAARLVTNIGGRVIEIGDWSEKLEGCQVRATLSAKKSYTLQKLATVFTCQPGEDLEEESRWDILVILVPPRQ